MARKIEVGVLMGVFILVAGCVSVPIIVYVTSSQDTANEVALIETLMELFDIKECSSSQKVRSFSYVYLCMSLHGEPWRLVSSHDSRNIG